MKKIIDKLFEWLGYVPKKKYEDILYNARDLQKVYKKKHVLYKKTISTD